MNKNCVIKKQQELWIFQVMAREKGNIELAFLGFI